MSKRRRPSGKAGAGDGGDGDPEAADDASKRPAGDAEKSDDAEQGTSADLAHPIVVAQIERALSPYRRLLPADVLTGFGKALSIVLSSHPGVVGLVRRLHESTQYDGTAPPAPRVLFEGDTLLWHHIQVALMERLRAYTRRKGRMPMVPPEASETAFYICTMSFQDSAPETPEKEGAARARVEGLCDALTGALFFGLVCHVAWAPDTLAEWGDTGRVLSVVQPQAKAALRRAIADLPKPDAAVLDLYERHLGDMQIVTQSMHVSDDDALAYVARAFERLGVALRVAVEASPRKRRGLH